MRPDPTETRYNRQIRLPEIGTAGQHKLAQASVLCVGAGGLGAPVLLYLAGAGIGHIGIIDGDCVDESNLQRQVIFTQDMIGKPKASAAAQALAQLNPHIHIEAYDVMLNADNAPALITGYDIIVDGTDNFEAKFLINDACVKFGKPWVYGAIQGFDGRASVFNSGNGACYRCLQPAAPKSTVVNCADAGVIGAVAGIIGVTQALQVIQIVTGHADFSPLSSQLWVIDTRTMHTHAVTIAKNTTCPTCSKKPEDITLHYAPAPCTTSRNISAQDAKAATGYILVDVREQPEWDNGHIEGARLCPLSQIRNGNIPMDLKDTRLLLYCQRGMRSRQAADILRTHGFSNLTNLDGGYEAWCLCP